jgi:hypothetical protein
MTAIVVDTNVLAVSEGRHDGASDACVAACATLARRIQEGRATVVVDEADEILTEYLRVLGQDGSSGIGVKLARRLRQRKYDDAVCRRVPITPIECPPGSYEEVPEGLRDFDLDDQKFLAVARADRESPPLFAGIDQEWWRRRADLAAAGFDIQFPCSDDLLDLDG